MQLLFTNRIVSFNQAGVFDSFYKNSGSLQLDKSNKLLRFDRDSKPFDPYIIFSPLAELAMPGKVYVMALIAPFLLFIIVAIVAMRKKCDLTIRGFLMGLIIISIPLKIAWTSFCVLLLCAFCLGDAIYHRKLQGNKMASYLFLTLFIILILVGRPTHISVIEKEFSLLFYALIAVTLAFLPNTVPRVYTFTMLVLNALVVVAGINFLIWFHDFYGLVVADYFREIKIYSGEIRKWLPYDHAAFLSLFGLAGLLFAHELRDLKKLMAPWLYLYHVLLLLFIILVGTRICLVIYGVYLLNIGFGWPHKKMILINSVFFILFSAALFVGIQKFDPNRFKLWAISWDAIKEQPYFGYGLDQSKSVLHALNSRFELPLDFNHSHNQFLTFLLEIGFAGFGLLTATVLIYLYTTKQYRNKTLLLFLFGLAYIFLTESILLTSKPLYIIGLLFLIIVSARQTSVTPHYES
jgi:hypothetical protein